MLFEALRKVKSMDETYALFEKVWYYFRFNYYLNIVTGKNIKIIYSFSKIQMKYWFFKPEINKKSIRGK